MQGETELIIEATRKASRFLYRDFFELANLQSTGKSNQAFVSKSYSRAVENLNLSLSKYYKKIIFEPRDAQNLETILATTIFDKIALVYVLDGSNNLERAMPFFGVMVTILVRKSEGFVAERAVLDFPALSENYYAERGKGAWAQNHSSNFSGAVRARISGASETSEAFIACGTEEIDIASKISKNIRTFGSHLYSIALLVSGKVDIGLCPKQELTDSGFELFVKESGGVSFVSKAGLFVGSNVKLEEGLQGLA